MLNLHHAEKLMLRSMKKMKKSLWFALVIMFLVAFAFGFSALPLFSGSFRPVLPPSGGVDGTNSVVHESDDAGRYLFPGNRIDRSRLHAKIQDAVLLPDEILLFQKYPPAEPKFTVSSLRCLFYHREERRAVLLEDQDRARLRFFRLSTPKRLLIRLRDAYVKMMLGLDNSAVFSGGYSFAGEDVVGRVASLLF